MKLYTLNATPLKGTESPEFKAEKMADYPLIVAEILNKYDIDGFTIYQVHGYWQGVAEDSFKIEIAIDPKKAYTIHKVAEALRAEYDQDAVMVTYPDGYVEFI